jgi:hypothetical protein
MHLLRDIYLYENSRDIVLSLHRSIYYLCPPYPFGAPLSFAMLWRQNFEILKDATGESLHHMFHSFSFPLALSPIFSPSFHFVKPRPLTRRHTGSHPRTLFQTSTPYCTSPFPTAVFIQCNSGLKNQVLGEEFFL